MPRLTPQNVVEFMSVNVVKTPTDITNDSIPYADRERKLVWATLGSAFPSVLTNTTGGQVYALEFVPQDEAEDDPDAFLIYWVEYQADGDGVATWLGTDALLMFTAIMTGCTFGLGSATLDGVRAAHVNSKSASQTGTPDTAQMQDQHRKLVSLGLTAKEVTMDKYLPGTFDPKTQTTPFGFRPQLPGGRVPNRTRVGDTPAMSLPWKFCWQKYKVMGKNVTLLGVEQHAGGLF